MRTPKNKAVPFVAQLMLCLLWASASLRADLLPGSIGAPDTSPFMRQVMVLGACAVFACLRSLACEPQWPRGRALGLSVVAGIGLFVAPAVLIALAQPFIDDSTRVALFSLVPVFAVVLEPHISSAHSPQLRSGLAAALTAVVGTLLVFPLELPQSTGAAFAFVGVFASMAAIAAANCAAIRVLASSAPSTTGFAAVASGSAALILASLAAFTQRHISLPFDPWIVVDLFALALLFWLLRRMTAVQMTTRFLIAPLLANFIGLAFLRPAVQIRGWVGLALIALGSGWLLLASDAESERTTTSSLTIHQL